ncbi:MAG: hypothetical protein N3A58_04990 [Spirochaetes bacterium]|nr:hypothetical protein [Spirochaetota bacterium]
MKKKLFYFIFIFIILSFFCYSINAQNLRGIECYSQNNYDNINVERKDPLVAALLSWYMPGLGLIYSESFIKGFVYYSIDTFLLGYIISKIASFKVSVNQIIGFNLFGFTDLKGFDFNRVQDVGLLGILWIGFRIFNIIDSAFTAYNYNLKNNIDYGKEISVSPFFAGLMSWLYPGSGQFFVKDYFLGSIFVMIDFLQKVYLFGILVSQFPNAEKPLDLLNNIENINFNDLSLQTKIVIISYLTIDIGKRVFSSIFAYNKAKEINSKNETYVNNFYSFSLFPILYNNFFGLGFSLRF